MIDIGWLSSIAASGGCCDEESMVFSSLYREVTVSFAATKTEHDGNVKESR